MFWTFILLLQVGLTVIVHKSESIDIVILRFDFDHAECFLYDISGIKSETK